MPLALRLFLWLATEVLFVFRAGTVWGLWMNGFAKHLPNLWGYPCRISAPCGRDEAIAGLLLLRGVWGDLSQRQRWQCTASDRTLGNSVGAIESVACSVGASCTFAVGNWSRFVRLPASYIPLPSGGCARVPCAPGFRIVTWLILPVVICLSQRLSHACLSISNYTVKLRMAH